MSEKIVIIVQARLGSTRLPGKILKPLNGFPVLEHVLDRCATVLGRENVICAGVDDPTDEPARELVESLGIEFFAGDEKDVLSRYYLAAKSRQADWVVRVTSDCPLLDPKVCKGLIETVIAENADIGGLEGWPHGLDCEIVRFSALERAYINASLPEDREHVTLWIRTSGDEFKKLIYRPQESIPEVNQYRWVVDYPEDYQFLQQLFSQMDIQPNDYPEWKNVVEYLEKYPELLEINKHRIAHWAKNNELIVGRSKSGHV